jgi:hypothetical protein
MRMEERGGRPVPLAAGCAVVAAILMAGAGCRSAEEWSYDRPRVTPFELDRDLTQCAQQSRPTGALAYPSMTGPDRQALNKCMEKRGYTVIRRPSGS